jgi:hypothetical protein
MVSRIRIERRVTENVFLFSVANRPRRLNRGKGGAVAQLQAISDQISDKGKQKKHKDMLIGIPVNAMAPVGPSRKTVS